MDKKKLKQSEIYLITNKNNNKMYIGQTTSYYPCGRKGGYLYRWKRHIRNSKNNIYETKALTNAIKKYGEKSFKVELLLLCDKNKADYFECRFIKLYNTICPNGYNIESGGTKNKKLHLNTRKIISSKNRFRYMSKKNINKVKCLLEDLKIEKLPMGIQYSNDTKKKYEGFVVSIIPKKSFTAKSRTLKEKLQQALKYYELIKNNDKNGIKKFNENLKKKALYLISSYKRKTLLVERAKKAMSNIGISELPMYVRYEKRSERFYVKFPDQGCKYFKKHDPEESLKQAINYIKQQQRESV